MTCSQFIERFSEYVDGVGDPECIEAARAHVAECESCQRYEAAYRRGVQLLRSFSSVRVSDDFQPGLDRRIRREHRRALRSLDRREPTSGSMALVFGMAVVLAGAAWSPFLLLRPVQVDLPPIQAAAPSSSSNLRMPMPRIRMLPDRRLRPEAALNRTDLWDGSSALFQQYAPVLRGYQAGGTRVGLD